MIDAAIMFAPMKAVA
jgi:hypothetical protein